MQILFLSRMEKRKGLYILLKAFKMLSGKNYNVSLTIAGDGPELSDAVKYIRNEKLAGNVTFKGYVKGDEKKKIYGDISNYIDTHWDWEETRYAIRL